jgi:hypothetical protein
MADRPLSRGFKSRHQIEENQKLRLPPGQYVTMDFPVLSAGPTPQIKLENWTFPLQADDLRFRKLPMAPGMRCRTGFP